MVVAIGPGSHAESFIWAATLCARRAGRSAEDRLLCKQEVLGSNPSRSTPVPYLPRFKSTFRTVPGLGLGSSAWPCLGHGTGSYQARSGSVGTRATTTSSEPKGASSTAQPKNGGGRVREPEGLCCEEEMAV